MIAQQGGCSKNFWKIYNKTYPTTIYTRYHERFSVQKI